MLFAILYFFFWPFCCLFFFDIWILVTPLVSSNSSWKLRRLKKRDNYRCDGIKPGSVPPKNTHYQMLLITNCCKLYSTYIKLTILNKRVTYLLIFSECEMCIWFCPCKQQTHVPATGIYTGHISTARCSGKEFLLKFVCFTSNVSSKNMTLISFHYHPVTYDD